jgi:hypothetical protein
VLFRGRVEDSRNATKEPPRECSTVNVNTVYDLHDFQYVLSKSDVLTFHFFLIPASLLLADALSFHDVRRLLMPQAPNSKSPWP